MYTEIAHLRASSLVQTLIKYTHVSSSFFSEKIVICTCTYVRVTRISNADSSARKVVAVGIYERWHTPALFIRLFLTFLSSFVFALSLMFLLASPASHPLFSFSDTYMFMYTNGKYTRFLHKFALFRSPFLGCIFYANRWHYETRKNK